MLAVRSASSGRVIRATDCKQIFLGISSGYGRGVCSLSFCQTHFLSTTWYRNINFDLDSFILTYFFFVYCHLYSYQLYRLSCTVFSSLPFSLTVGPPALLFPGSVQNQSWVSLRSVAKLPGGENRLHCHSCPNMLPGWPGKQTVEQADRSKRHKNLPSKRVVFIHTQVYHNTPLELLSAASTIELMRLEVELISEKQMKSQITQGDEEHCFWHLCAVVKFSLFNACNAIVFFLT